MLLDEILCQAKSRPPTRYMASRVLRVGGGVVVEVSLNIPVAAPFSKIGILFRIPEACVDKLD